MINCDLSDEDGLVVDALRHKACITAKDVAKLIRESGINFRRTDANHCLYRLEGRAIVQRTADTVPLWSLKNDDSVIKSFESNTPNEHSDLDTRFLTDLGLLEPSVHDVE